LTDVTGQCSATLPRRATATDNCDVGTITGVPDKTGPFSQGDDTITWTFTDSKGNHSSQTQAVHVHDTTAPVASALSLTDVTASARPLCQQRRLRRTTAMWESSPECRQDWTVQPGRRYDYLDLHDSKGNHSSQTQAVHVHDTTAPVASALSLTDVTGQCSATLPAAPTATDNCDVGIITGVPDKTGPFSQGDDTITWTFTDSKGNPAARRKLCMCMTPPRRWPVHSP